MALTVRQRNRWGRSRSRFGAETGTRSGQPPDRVIYRLPDPAGATHTRRRVASTPKRSARVAQAVPGRIRNPDRKSPARDLCEGGRFVTEASHHKVRASSLPGEANQETKPGGICSSLDHWRNQVRACIAFPQFQPAQTFRSSVLAVTRECNKVARR